MNVKELKAAARRDLDTVTSQPAIDVHRRMNMREWWKWCLHYIPYIEERLSPEWPELYLALVAMEQFVHSYNVYLTAKKHGRGAAMALILTRKSVREET